MILFPHCKINLGLHVTARREDGFHEIETCFYPVRGLRDAVELLTMGNDGEEDVAFSSTGLSMDCPAKKNLCVKAYHLLEEAFPDEVGGVRIHLHKKIPFGAGLGGGSADATAVLKGVNELFELKLSVEELAEYAGRLGSDTACFLYDQPMIGIGRGERLDPVEGVDLSGWWLLLVKPNVKISTKEAYSVIKPMRPECDLKTLLQRPVEEWREKLVNNFEGPIFEQFPEIARIRKNLYDKGAVYAAMSGSGSAVYGLFREEPTVRQDDWKECFVHAEQL